MRTALVLVDIQNDYFPGGAMELVGIEQAAAQAGAVLALFREKELPVFHVQYIAARPGLHAFREGTKGVEINAAVQPLAGEIVVRKHFANSFRETTLLEGLREAGANRVIVCGAMSHMCVDATVRAAVDHGFECAVIHDACATRDLEFNGTVVPAAHVHAAIMAALAFAYGKVVKTEECGALLDAG